MKKHFFVVGITLLVQFFIFGSGNLELSHFFTENEIERINNGEIISRMFVKYNMREENSHESLEIPKTDYLNEDFDPYQIKADEKGFLPYVLTEESRLAFYNILSSYSKLTGMKYYSRRAGKVQVLVEECYRVKNISGTEISDLVCESIKPKSLNMFQQKDNKFGTLIYKSEVFNEGDNFILINSNAEPISKLIFNVTDPNEYKLFSYFIYDAEKKGFYYYSALISKINVDLLLKSKKVGPTAYSNRLRAASVHLAKLIGLNWEDKLNAWPGKYDTY